MKKGVTYIIIGITVLLGIAGIVTAYLLNTRQGVTPVAPTRPSAANNLQSCDLFSFTVTLESPSPSPTASPTPPPPDTPSIDIEKHTNGYDADNPKGPELTEGDDVKWEYIVTNTGSVTLYNVVVVDNKEGVIKCPKSTLVAGETMICTLHSTAVVYQYENTATVEAEDENNVKVTDTDTSHYWGEGKPSSPTPLPTTQPTSQPKGQTPAPTGQITRLPDTGSSLPIMIMIPAVVLIISAVFLL